MDLIKNSVRKVLYIPHDFHKRGDISLGSLLEESGYIELHEQIQENELIEELQTQPHLITEWLQWSDDKRSNFTWYFTRGDDGKCFVGHYPEGEEFKEINTSNEFEACAAFVKREIENIRMIIERRKIKSDTILPWWKRLLRRNK